MKSIAMLGLALAMSPTLVAADQTSAPDAATTMPRPNFAAMRQVHEQMETIRQNARLAILSSLTPAHRQALATIAGQLAIAPNPDRQAAARSLDAILTASESRSILATETSARTQSRALMESARAQFEASLTPDQRAAMQSRMAAREARGPRPEGPRPDGTTARTPDPGRTLLEMAIGGGGGGGGRHGFAMGGAPPEPPPQ